MPYFSIGQIKQALEDMQKINPLFVPILAMLRKGVPMTDDASKAKEYGSADEIEVLNQSFRPVGGPSERPYYMPFGDPQGKTKWRDRLYPGRTLQKLRTKDYIKFFHHPDKKRWAFKAVLPELLAAEFGKVALAPIAIWLYRREGVVSVKDALKRLVKDYGLSQGTLLSKTFDQSVPAAYTDADLALEPVGDDDLAGLLGIGAPPPPPAFSRAEFEAKIVSQLKKADLRVDESLVAGVIDAWLARDIVVLVGAPGTGKTKLALELSRALGEAFGQEYVLSVPVEVGRDYDLASFIGYENLEGRLVPREFTSKVLLDPERRMHVCAVVLDEWNLASIDDYLSPVLSAIETGVPITLPGSLPDSEGRVECDLPIDTLIIATCNSYLDEPDTRLPMSGPVKRRCTIFMMHNLLATDVATQGIETALRNLAELLLRQEKTTLQRRTTGGAATQLDAFRNERLAAVKSYNDVDAVVRKKLEGLVELLLSRPSGKRFLTIGVFKDVLLNVIYAQPADAERALVTQVAGKLLHLCTGDAVQLKGIRQLFEQSAQRHILEEVLSRLEEAAASAAGQLVPIV